MLVRERMTINPITINPDASHEQALELLREKKIRRLPVLDKQGELVGIVVEKDLLYASPSPATSLSVFEIHYLLSKLKIKDIMTKRVITVEEDCPLEEAARIMVDHKIGSLPVVRGKQLIGIITETDLFCIMAEALGGREKGLRVTVQVGEAKGQIAKLTSRIAEVGGNIIALAVFHGADPAHYVVTLKVQQVTQDVLIAAIKKAEMQITDLRDVNAEYSPYLISSR